MAHDLYAYVHERENRVQLMMMSKHDTSDYICLNLQKILNNWDKEQRLNIATNYMLGHKFTIKNIDRESSIDETTFFF